MVLWRSEDSGNPQYPDLHKKHILPEGQAAVPGCQDWGLRVRPEEDNLWMRAVSDNKGAAYPG